MKRKRVSLHWVRAIVQAAEAVGVGPKRLLEVAEVAPTRIHGGFGFLTLNETMRIWRAAEDLSGDPSFGLHMGERVRPSYFSVVAYAVMSCAYLDEALEGFQRYQRLISEGGRIELVAHEDTTSVIYQPLDDAGAFSRHQIEAVMVIIVGFSSWLVSKDLKPLVVTFSHARPDDVVEHERLFGCPLRFGASQNAILIENRWLRTPLPESDPDMLRIHRAQADMRLQQMDEESMSDRVRGLMERSNHFEWNRDGVAKRLCMSTRTLQRRLKEAGTSFQKIFDDYRHRAALDLLRDPEVDLNEIGPMLGFSEPSTFYRAFKRWEGVAPGEYRRTRG